MLEHILKRLADLEQEVYELKLQNQHLQKKLEEHKTIEIGKIIYKIQELSVDTLSGILNVGISATNSTDQKKWIEELMSEKKVEWQVDSIKGESPDERTLG
jgi:hypothetical protein